MAEQQGREANGEGGTARGTLIPRWASGVGSSDETSDEAEMNEGRISRRTWIKGAAAAGATIAAAGAEYASLRGAFDHMRDLGFAGRQRYLSAVAEVEGGTAKAGIVHICHSTHLLMLGGARLLTDPWFYDPAFGALSHESSPAVAPSDVGRLDAILISHDHADHADLRAVDQMDKRATAIVATADLAARVRKLGFAEVVVLKPWEEMRVGATTVAAVPGVHDIYEIGFVVRAGEKSVYFAGDTRLHDDLPQIAERFAPSAAILPVDGTRLTGGDLHVMTPDDAVTAARTLKCRIAMPSHDEAYFSDYLVKYVLASMVPSARFRFADAVAAHLPGVRCEVPLPGDLVTI